MNRKVMDPQDDFLPMNEWWDKCHENEARYYLTDSQGIDVWGHLRIPQLISPGTVVLNIGVGTGRCTRDLVLEGCTVCALDISSIALNRVATIATTIQDASELPADTFDLAISHLVVQHTGTAFLAEQMKYVVASLKPDGIFACQFASSTNGRNFDEDEPPLYQRKAGIACRSVETMVDIANRNGAACIVFPIPVTTDLPMKWWGMHVRRRPV